MTDHKHVYTETPSYTMKSSNEVELVWVCQAEGYCYEQKREINNNYVAPTKTIRVKSDIDKALSN